MSLGSGILLFVIGAILAFAVRVQVAWVDLQLIGYILMAAGVVVIIIGSVLLTRRRRSTSTSRSAIDPATGERVSQRTSDVDDPII
jgi:membrane protein implicated in regulation of membrane protease activity